MKVAGMVDVVARIVADGDVRSFCFKSNEVIFGGGRLKVNAKDIPLDVNALFAVYDEANKAAAHGGAVPTPAPAATPGRTTRKRTETPATGADKPQDSPEAEGTVNNTPDEETPQEAAETPAQSEPQPEAENPPMNPPEAPAEDEKPRRKRKARE